MEYIISISRLVGPVVEVRGIGHAEAESMQDLMQKLDVGEIVRTLLQPSHTSIYFTEAGKISTPEELRERVLKMDAEFVDSDSSARYATISQAVEPLWIAMDEAVESQARIETRVNLRYAIRDILEKNGVSVERIAELEPQFHVNPQGIIYLGPSITLEKFMLAVARAMN